MIGTFNLPISSTGTTLTGFVTEWLASGDTTARTIALPLVNGYNYDAVVYWGDNTSSVVKSYNDTGATHTYSSNGTYTVNVVGTMEGWSFNNTGDKLKIKKVINFGGPHFNGFKYLFGGFYGCTNLNSLGSNPIKPSGTGLVSNGITNAFRQCTSLTSLPTDLFRYNPNITELGETFSSCTSLTSLPADLFRYNTKIIYFYWTFRGCTSLSSLPVDIFKYNTDVQWFERCFENCTSLTSLPADLFRYNTKVTVFALLFAGCNKLQQNATIFAPTGVTNRFTNQSVNFTQCFYRTSFTGTQGVAPDLWNQNFGTGTPTKTDCWEGAGNSVTSLSNYASIPADWK